MDFLNFVVISSSNIGDMYWFFFNQHKRINNACLSIFSNILHFFCKFLLFIFSTSMNVTKLWQVLSLLVHFPLSMDHQILCRLQNGIGHGLHCSKSLTIIFSR
ncbi:hypothetical protein CHS0354_028144 [Potamilus streckersoni]|uniref:Uncharacterized protein n=1 Tax=Potamilus streckersoni TaxID=2493646 RepID=A0AAE0TI05_9BIVA|nr:hypothetical protein CHS0354_028144 [Potamilus streckersoni]